MWFGLFFFGTPEGTRYAMVSFPSSRERASVHRTLAFKWFESLLTKTKFQIPEWVSGILVHRKGLEPPTLGTGIRCSIH